MQILLLFVILAVLILGPRRGGRMPGPIAIAVGDLLLLWLGAAFGLSWVWNMIVGPVAQP